MDKTALKAAMAAATPRPRPVEVPAWGGTVYVKALTLAEAEALGEDSTGDPKRKLARGLAATIVDEKGKRLFDPDDGEDLDLIGSQGMTVLGPIITAANATNAAAPDSAEQLGNA